MKPVSIETIYTKLRAIGVREIVLMDAAYVAPTPEWLREFGGYLSGKKLEFIPETFDCEQFARWAAHEADLALVKAGLRDAGHTFGEATCLQDRSAHSLNLCLCSDETLYAFEPQTGVVTPADGFALWTRVRM
jgi:hypothetical protein